MSAEQLGDLIGKSAYSVQSWEAGRLALSEKTAQEIAAKTGVSLNWLLKGDPKAPPVDDEGKPWTKARYETRSAQLSQLASLTKDVQKLWTEAWARSCAGVLKAILMEQWVRDPDRPAIVTSRVNRFLSDLKEEFGADQAIIDETVRRWQADQSLEMLEELGRMKTTAKGKRTRGAVKS